MREMKIFCSLVMIVTAIGGMFVATEAARPAENPLYGLLAVAASVAFGSALIGRCVLERGRQARDDA